MQDRYLTSMGELSHLLRHKRGDAGRGRLLWTKRRRENLRGIEEYDTQQESNTFIYCELGTLEDGGKVG